MERLPVVTAEFPMPKVKPPRESKWRIYYQAIGRLWFVTNEEMTFRCVCRAEAEWLLNTLTAAPSCSGDADLPGSSSGPGRA